MRTVLGGYVDRSEMPGLVALVSRGEAVHVEALGALSFGGLPMQRDSICRIASMTKPITAAAAMILVEECRLRLDDPVDEFLPELANRKVLRLLDAPLDDVVPAKRVITLRDLLTFRWGFGAVMVWAAERHAGVARIVQAMIDKELAKAGPRQDCPTMASSERGLQYARPPYLSVLTGRYPNKMAAFFASARR
jgi:CubicO group peptidase (beta-lactamase class C family)